MSDAHPFDATTPDARRASPQAELATPPAPASGPAADAVDPALVEEAIALVRRWLSEAESLPADPSGQRLAGVLKDAGGLDFTVGFVDGVVRPEDTSVAAHK
ncbi:MAG TPA: hypothetical protein PLK46_05285, partial [Propioniciclava sp.]|nr:hypothetical protein [Propioniciclava sp.]